jgi:hypothetical protein
MALIARLDGRKSIRLGSTRADPRPSGRFAVSPPIFTSRWSIRRRQRRLLRAGRRGAEDRDQGERRRDAGQQPVWRRRTGPESGLSSPHSAAFVPAGIIVADRDDNRIRLLSGTGLEPA